MDHEATDAPTEERTTRESSRARTDEHADEGAAERTDKRTDEHTNARAAERTDEPRDDLRTDDTRDDLPADDLRANDLHITVEPGIPRPADLHVEPDTADLAGAAPEDFEGCPHRVRVRDLTTGGRVLFAVGLIVIVGAGIVQLLALFLGGFLLSIGAEISGTVPVVNGALLVLGSMLGMIGVFALVGTWRRLHRPEAPIAWLTAAGTLLTCAALFLIGLWVDMPVAAVGALPSGAVAAILIYLRTALAPRETCDTEPALPERARAWLA